MMIRRFWGHFLDPKMYHFANVGQTSKCGTSLALGKTVENHQNYSKSSSYSHSTPPRCPRNVSGSKMKNRFFMMIFDDDLRFWGSDFWMMICDFVDDRFNIAQVVRDPFDIGRSDPNHHQKHCFCECSCKWSPACEI